MDEQFLIFQLEALKDEVEMVCKGRSVEANEYRMKFVRKKIDGLIEMLQRKS
jgi:hypothetical protein